MDSRIGHQVGLEFGEIDVKGTVETQRGGDGRNNLANQSVKIGVCWPFNVEISTTDVVDCFVIDHECAVRMFQSGVRGEDGVVRFNNSS